MVTFLLHIFATLQTEQKCAMNISQQKTKAHELLLPCNLLFTRSCGTTEKWIDLGNDCLVSVDGADFIMQGFPSVPFSKQKAWCTKKHSGPSIRHEVGLSILGGDIVWIHGDFPCCDWPDIEIFGHAPIHFLDPHEHVEADKGHRGEAPRHVKHPGLLAKDGWHETVNEKFKNFKALLLPFLHDVDKHPTCFKAVAVLMQLAVKNGDPLFTVNCCDQ